MASIKPVMRWKPSAELVTYISETIQSELASGIKSLKTSLASSTSPSPFATLSDLNGRLASRSAMVTIAAMAGTDGEASAAANAARSELQQAWAGVWGDGELYRLLQATPAPPQPTEEATYRAKVLALMARSGAGKESVRSVEEVLAETTAAFDANLNGDNSKVVLRSDEMNGLPDAFVEGLEVAGEEGAGVGIPLKRPFLVPAMKHLVSGAARKKLYVASASQCLAENAPLFDRMLELRHQSALAKGYASHAEEKTSADIPGSVGPVFAMLEELAGPARAKMEDEVRTLAEIKAEMVGAGNMVLDDGSEPDKVETWDMSILLNEYKSRTYAVDDAKVKPYFELWAVIGRIFELYSHLFDVSFVKTDGGETLWHSDVIRYEVYAGTGDARGELAGVIYLDLFPRENKYGHQCVVPLVPAFTGLDGSRSVPSAVILGNNTKPTASDPALLLFSEVHTLLHEIGHLIHAVLTQSHFTLNAWAWSVVPWRGGVEMSFLETPSQMFENWLYQPSVLSTFGVHYKTGDRIPDDLVSSLIATRHTSPGYRYVRQIAISMFDLIAHSSPGPPFVYTPWGISADSIPDLVAALYAHLGLNAPEPGTNFAASFFHATTYSAAYYGYLWAEISSADCFTAFEDDPMSQTQGIRFRDLVLARGATISARTMLRNFLGRDVANAAFLAQVGFQE